jgi:hypothetical protein
LIEDFLGLVRELGRIPVEAELRMKRRQSTTFPSDRVFGVRFGSKGQLIEAVLEYCRTHAGFDDVVPLFLAAQGARRSNPRVEERDDPQQNGSVYLLKVGRHYKIGKTNSFGRREYELAIQLPEKAKTVHVIQTDDPSGIEAYWHNRFAAKRGNGEWFELDSSDVRVFKRRKFQ